MRIYDNGVYRDMTQEEINTAYPPLDTDDEATESDYIDALSQLGVVVE